MYLYQNEISLVYLIFYKERIAILLYFFIKVLFNWVKITENTTGR